MKKFTKGMLIAAGIFGAVGIGLTAAGGVMGASMSELTGVKSLKRVLLVADGDYDYDDSDDYQNSDGTNIGTGDTDSNEDLPMGEGDVNMNEGKDPVQLYTPNSRAGQIFGLKVAGVAGIEYSLSPGLILGFEVQPVAYRYDHIQICPKGQAAYKVGHHNINFFATPNLKIGFRF